MKKTLLTLLVLSIGIVLHSQNENPFKKFGYDVLVATSSNGEFQEFHDQTDTVEIGSVLFNTRTNEIVKVLEKDETTIDISSATAAMSIDPLCEKYYWISPYVYCANNPIKWIDLKGDSLTYHGDRDAAINMHNTHLGGYYTTSTDANGLVSMSAVSGMDLSKMTPEQKAYADALGAVVNGTDGMTTINVVSGDNGVLFGDITTATIDVGDMGKLPTAELAPITSGSVLIHEVTEQYNMQVKSATLDARNPAWDAHKKATRVEGSVIQQRLGVGPERTSTLSTPGSTSGYMDVNSSNGKARVHIRNNNVTGVSYFR
jgi:hypothetical protein